MKIALYQEFGEGCRRLTHELLPATAGWELLDVPHAGADIASLAAEDAETIRSAEVVIASPLSPFPDAHLRSARAGAPDPAALCRLRQG